MRAITLLVRANDTHTCRCNDKGINGEGRVRCDPLSIGSFTVNLANYVSLSDALSLSLCSYLLLPLSSTHGHPICSFASSDAHRALMATDMTPFAPRDIEANEWHRLKSGGL